ncbi:DegT/DnrJ/EryC1/StrS family aminotransferase [Arthrospiribacter ruber]|nr:DegT/DnrJ/EryC1/StrS family aminotransferase [Arthrospiribacter ruber]
MNIPFLDLQRIPVDVKIKLENKFSSMLHSGVFSGGKEVENFEKKMAQRLDCPDFLACSNGTDALEIALRLLQIGPGDKVAVPALTWVSTAEVVKILGADIVFVDTDPDGLIDLEKLQKTTSDQLKAVIPVHLYGKMVDMEKLCSWANKNSVKVIEDNAQGFGSTLYGKAAGTWGNVGCFSFYPTKNLGALGEAGGLVLKDQNLLEQAKRMINHGQSSRDVHDIIGKNARIDSLQAAFLNIFLDHFDHWQYLRKNYAQIYLDKLSGLSDLALPSNCHERSHNLHLFTIQTPERDKLKPFLKQKGIGTAVHYPKIIPEMDPYKDDGDYPVAKSISQQTLSLPLNPFLDEKEVVFVSDTIRRFFNS